MCIIIYRPAGKVIPFKDFESSVLNNPDGYGFTLPKGNGTSLLTLRSHQKADPEALYRIVQEEYLSAPVMLHLRYNTAGETSMRNAHPFPILEERTHGEDLRMAHNGTITKWKAAKNRKNWESDTRFFTRGFLRPLFSRLIKSEYAPEILKDEWVGALIKDQIPDSSVLTFLDAEGGFHTINELGNGGFWRDGVYYSNKYSLNPTHRESDTYTGGSKKYYGGWDRWMDGIDDYDDEGKAPFFKTRDKVKNKVSGLTGTVKSASKGWVDVVLDTNGHTVCYQASALELYTEETQEDIIDMIDNLTPETVCDCSNSDLDKMREADAELLVAKLVDIIVELEYNSSFYNKSSSSSTDMVVLN